MKLTKEQIKYIDDYLKEQKVNFWDVRIELIDHIASKLEENEGLILDRTFLIKEFGTQITLNKVISEKEISIKKKYRSLRFKEVFSMFKSPMKLLGLIAFVFSYYFVFSKFPTPFFIKISTVLFYFPILISIYFSVYNYIKKNNSIHLKSASYFLMISVVLLNPFIMQLKEDSSFSQKLFVFILISLNSIYIYASYRVYLKVKKKYSEIYKELQSL